MKKLVMTILFLIPVLSVLSQEIIVTETGDTMVMLRGLEVATINKAFLDLKYTRLELETTDSILGHQRNTISALSSALDLKDEEIGLYRKELSGEKKKKTKTGIYSSGIGLILGIIVGILL